ncbi:MAG: DUF3352 domain-containing protein [Desmonostoc vinosum HA7617-LM4]|nr:DUF3352 domain-containing protein [Desmonostoc vinosum HA7617-LM4]
MLLPAATLSLLSTLTVAAVPETNQPSLSSGAIVANVLPADTPLVGLVNTRAETWKTLGRFQLVQKTWTAVSQFLPVTAKFDYTKNVESWLGEQVTVAFMPKVGSTVASIDANFLLLAPVKDDKRLQLFLAQLQADTQGSKVRQYKGVNILELETPEVAPTKNKLPPSLQKLPKLKKRGVAIATFPGYVVTGITAQPIEQLIDTAQGNATLAQNPQFQQTIERSRSGKVLFTIYENLSTFVPLISDISKDPNLPFPGLSVDAISPSLNEYSTIDGFLTVQTEGLRFQVNAYHQTSKSAKDDLITQNHQMILSRLPAATYSALTGRNLNQQWLKLAQTISTKAQLKDLLATFRNFFRSSTGLDLEKDIMSWMDGEYALFFFPTKGGLFKLASPNFNLGIGLAVQTTNRAAADTTFKKLDQFIKSLLMGGIIVNTQDIKGQSVTSWDLGGDSAQSLLAYSWVNQDTVVVATGFSAIADLVPQPYVKLPATYNFRTATNSLPRPNRGYFYVNMGSFLSWFYGFVPIMFNDQNSQSWKEIIGSIYSISATTSTTPEREQFDILVVLAPSRK